MAWKPWSQFNADINTEIARSSAGSDGPQDTPSGDAASGSGNATGVLVQTESGEPDGECPSWAAPSAMLARIKDARTQM